MKKVLDYVNPITLVAALVLIFAFNLGFGWALGCIVVLVLPLLFLNYKVNTCVNNLNHRVVLQIAVLLFFTIIIIYIIGNIFKDF